MTVAKPTGMRDLGVASPAKSWRRLRNKLLQFVARDVPFVPGRWRALMQSWRGVQFIDRKSVFLGEHVYFDDIYPELICVGRNVRITDGARILSHYFDTRHEPSREVPFRFYKGRVVIEDNVFIGMGAVVAAPLSIGAGAVIGANSLVTRDVPANAIALGVPATVMGERPAMRPH